MYAFIPVAVVALAVLLAAVLKFSERSFFGTALEDQFYGFFFRSYPLFLFAVAYGVARIVVAALWAPGRRRSLRAFTAPLALALFLAATLYPSVGGFILRPGYATGGVSFLQGLSADVAVVLGAGASAFMYGLVLGLCTLIATLNFQLRWRSLGDALLAFITLWSGALLLVMPQRVGIDFLRGFPVRPIGLDQVLPLAILVVLAFLPHAVLKSATGVRVKEPKPFAA
jgi:hypothetical protein